MGTYTVLAVKTHALGDLLLTTPALRHVRIGLPDARILMLTTAGCAPLLQGNPDIDDLIALRDLTPASALRALPELRRAAPSHAVVFQVSPWARLLARLSGAPTVHALGTGGAGEWPPPFDRYTADAYVALADQAVLASLRRPSYPRLFVDPTERAAARRLAGGAPFAVVAPGGGRNPRQSVSAKRWAALPWARVCEMLRVKQGIEVLLVGADDDTPHIREVAAEAAVPLRNLSGATDLRSLAALIAEAVLVVTIDSVALHMAVALDRPLVGLFGPTSCANFLPPGRDHQRGVSSSVLCSPCYGNCLFPGCRMGNPVCMGAITVDEVWDAVRSVLG